MNDLATGLLVVVWLPLLALWGVVMVDLVRQPSPAPLAKVLWAIACTLVWPALIVYLMRRPTRGRLEDPEHRTDPQALLVAAVLDHEAGRLDDAGMAVRVAQLRRV